MKHLGVGNRREVDSAEEVQRRREAEDLDLSAGGLCELY